MVNLKGKIYYLYILECCDGSFYTGITNNLEKRFANHRNGIGSKYVRARLPFKHIYTEEFPTKSEAMKREYEIKSLKREEKLDLVKK